MCEKTSHKCSNLTCLAAALETISTSLLYRSAIMFASWSYRDISVILLVIFFESPAEAFISNSSYLVEGIDGEYYPESLPTLQEVVSLSVPKLLTPTPIVLSHVLEIIQYMTRPIILTAFLCSTKG